MDIKRISSKLVSLIDKYKYAILVLFIGLILLWIPTNRTKTQNIDPVISATVKHETLTQESLAQILQSVEGAGKVKVYCQQEQGSRPYIRPIPITTVQTIL